MSDSVTQWTVARQAPLSMEFSSQEYWSGLPCPPPGDLPNPGIEPRSLALQADSLLSEPPEKPMKKSKCSAKITFFVQTGESEQPLSFRDSISQALEAS